MRRTKCGATLEYQRRPAEPAARVFEEFWFADGDGIVKLPDGHVLK